MKSGNFLPYYPITLSIIYFLFLLSIFSLGSLPLHGISRLASSNDSAYIGVRVFLNILIYDNLFTYVVVVFLFYNFRNLELLMGPYVYFSLLVAVSLCVICLRFLQMKLYTPAYGCITISSAFFVVYCRVIPSVRMESIPLYKHFAVNNRVLLCFITILLSLSCGVVGLIDMCLGFGIGYGLLSLHITYHILQWFPSFIPWAICKAIRTLFVEDPSFTRNGDDDVIPFFPQPHQQGVNSASVTELMEMGYSRTECESALLRAENDVNRAAEILLQLNYCAY